MSGEIKLSHDDLKEIIKLVKNEFIDIEELKSIFTYINNNLEKIERTLDKIQDNTNNTNINTTDASEQLKELNVIQNNTLIKMKSIDEHSVVLIDNTEKVIDNTSMFNISLAQLTNFIPNLGWSTKQLELTYDDDDEDL